MDPREHVDEIILALEREYPMAECTLDHREATSSWWGCALRRNARTPGSTR